MIPYKSNRLTAVPKTIEVRLEIMKAIRALVSPDDVLKFDPDQPRVPAGNSDGGQWTSEGTYSTDQETLQPVARRMSPAEEAECTAQHARDSFICRLVRTRLCWEQAAERLGACLSGRQLPPLNF
jgi:hypothetical protein